MLFSKKNRIESSHCAFTFYFLNIAPLHQKDNTIHANSCFSALLLIAFSSNYTMYSKPLYNLLLIFFLAAVPFIYFDRAFMILCAHRAQLCGKIRLFCCISLFLRNYLFRMRLFAAGPGGWLGALWEGWQVCGARFPFFCGAMGTPRPCKRFAAAGVCGGLHARQRDAVLPLQRGAGLLQICHSLFCSPCPAPDSRFPLADFYLRQLLRCI